jgi:ferredoxin--NADP+ reductase
VPTEERETLSCGIVFRSVGYRGVSVPGVPFDEKTGTIPNQGGRVEPGLYTAGWIKRGPTGVIGTNKKDATETVELLLEDAAAGRLPRSEATAADVDALLDERGVRRVMYTGWQAIDERERAAGEKQGRPRVKLATWDELLDAAEQIASLPSEAR